MFTNLVRCASRSMATAAYPFSKTVLVHPAPAVPPPAALKSGKGLMPYLSTTLPTPEKQQMLRQLFSRKSADQLYPGSIVSVTLEHAPTNFVGILLAIRRRGPDTSFVVRNVVQRTGVEMQFFVNSPHLKEIKVLQRPPKDELACRERKDAVERRQRWRIWRTSTRHRGLYLECRGFCVYRQWKSVVDIYLLATLSVIDIKLLALCQLDTNMRASFFRSRRDSERSRGRSPSPTFSEATNVSYMHLPNGPEKIISRRDLKASISVFEELMETSANYRAALVNLSDATAALANAMQASSVLKGPSYEAGTRLQAASGLHHLIGNQWHVLAETLNKKFEQPLRAHLDVYKSVVSERSASYEKALREKSQIIRDTEQRNMNRKERNLQTFREALAVLQRQVDDLDDLKVAHYNEIVEHEEEVWDVVQSKTCIAVRSTMDVFDKFTAKASDPVIEPMLQTVPDAFDSYGPPASEDSIFSILAPLSIMPSTSSSPMPTPIPELDAIEGLPVTDHHVWPTTSSVNFPSTSPQWSDDGRSDTSPRSTSPPTGRSKPSPSSTTRNPRKSESKLRSVLSPIDEALARQKSPDGRPGSLMGTIKAKKSAPPPADAQAPWAFSYNSDSDDRDDAKTPTHSSFRSTPPRSPPELERDTYKVPIAT
ncbi:RRM domain-containing protein [Mycena kentingensis (nom. inval.)]|nr:RRM domain-containing protein [Mycena kentingensis (nom. inval.)]